MGVALLQKSRKIHPVAIGSHRGSSGANWLLNVSPPRSRISLCQFYHFLLIKSSCSRRLSLRFLFVRLLSFSRLRRDDQSITNELKISTEQVHDLTLDQVFCLMSFILYLTVVYLMSYAFGLMCKREVARQWLDWFGL